MPRVDFYHLERGVVEEVLPKLLEKAYAGGKPILVKVGNEARVEALNTALWTYDDQSFLPHGTKKDGNAALQPIWLTAGEDNPNKASMLFLVDGALVGLEEMNNFERIFNLFDGKDEEGLQRARNFWKEVKSSGSECFYWQQDVSGRWNQKA